MRVVIDINILVSALIVPTGRAATVIRMWLDGKFTLLTCATHVNELRATLHKPRIADLIDKAGRLVNQIRKLAEDIDPLPCVERSSDPDDDYLLALAEAADADYLVTGDKGGLLDLGTHKGTRIISARDFAALFAGTYEH
ncbi:MAG TPA: putative toxin-antitoxin system toxin component, PIN family [Bryobacteraceae bacterium]|nr:putative toxin-antitoxin system toxin component, PIN family [Bryobacteraceae bacterium]